MLTHARAGSPEWQAPSLAKRPKVLLARRCWHGEYTNLDRRKRWFWKAFLGQILVRARFLSMFTQQVSVPGTAGSGPARAPCRSLFLLRSALICPEQSRPWDPAFPKWLSEIRFSV